MFYPKKNQKVLLIHCRRGLFSITKCKKCKYVWECENCARNIEKGVNLVAYRTKFDQLELLCHQCQKYYKYPLECPSCGDKQIHSVSGGIDDLAEQLTDKYKFNVKRIDKLKSREKIKNSQEYNQGDIWTTTRIFDPAIDYNFFDKIIFIQAQNLLASSDYLVKEEIINSLGNLFLSVIDNQSVELLFDTNSIEDDLFDGLEKLDVGNPDRLDVWNWYSRVLDQEDGMRKIFGYPPYINLILLTSHEKTFEKAKNKLISVKKYLDQINTQLDLEITTQYPYPARFLKRKGLFSYNLLIKYPRKYSKFQTLKKEIVSQASANNLQIRHNPKHIF